MSDIDRLAKLREFGLSEYASRAYLALLELGNTEARDVSRLAKVPIAKVYSTLDQLHERGLVEVQPGPPKRYAPVPFREFLGLRRSLHEREAAILANESPALEALFPIRGGAEVGDRGSVRLLRGREAIGEKVRSLLSEVQRDAILAMTPQDPARFSTIPGFPPSNGSTARLRALLSMDGNDHGKDGSPFGDRVETRLDGGAGAAEGVGTYVFDDSAALIVHYVPDSPSLRQGKDVAVLIEERAIVKAVRASLEAHWKNSR